ncbi:50S ribosomal protein L6 [Candidatus Woesearchaeota archaeon]|nr:50S ribosomal protein L6 [Candidatus Woesearchaeota archaeon]
MKQDLKDQIIIPEKVQVVLEKDGFLVKGPKGEVKRILHHPLVKVSMKEKEINLEAKKATKKEKALLNTFSAHLRNLIKGVQEPYVYKLRICAGPPKSHFPAQVTVKDSILSVKNFLGEKIPRELKLNKEVKVVVKDIDIIVESPDVEVAGRTASEIELLMRISGKDRRVFQDGIYIVEKP